MAEEIERRALEATELRAVVEEGSERVMVGYAARFNMLSEFIGEFREEIAPGAFGGVLAGDTRALFNHDANMVLGRTTNGTLRLSEDENGLRVAITMPDTRYADDLWALVQRGDITQMSFGFMVDKNGQEWRKAKGTPIRRITKVSRLLDVSVVTYPAYPQTSVEARSMAAEIAAGDEQIEVDMPTHVDDISDGVALPKQAAARNRKLKLLSIKR